MMRTLGGEVDPHAPAEAVLGAGPPQVLDEGVGGHEVDAEPLVGGLKA